MICMDCKNKCSEYLSNFISDKANWEWTRKMEKCELDKDHVFPWEEKLNVANGDPFAERQAQP